MIWNSVMFHCNKVCAAQCKMRKEPVPGPRVYQICARLASQNCALVVVVLVIGGSVTDSLVVRMGVRWPKSAISALLASGRATAEPGGFNSPALTQRLHHTYRVTVPEDAGR
jgi:hypothetical protein